MGTASYYNNRMGFTVPQTTVAYTGHRAEMFCNSYEVPQWTKKGEVNHLFNHTLIIEKLTEEDSGVYICRGTLNEEGQPFVASSELFVGGMCARNLY